MNDIRDQFNRTKGINLECTVELILLNGKKKEKKACTFEQKRELERDFYKDETGAYDLRRDSSGNWRRPEYENPSSR